MTTLVLGVTDEAAGLTKNTFSHAYSTNLFVSCDFPHSSVMDYGKTCCKVN